MKVVGLDLSPYKFGGCASLLFQPDKLELHPPVRIEYPARMNGRELSEKERSRSIIQTAVQYVNQHQPSVVLIEDTRITYMARGKDGNMIMKSGGYQDYYAKGVLFAMEFILESKGYEVHFVSNSSMISTCLGKGVRTGRKKAEIKEMGRQHINQKHGLSCQTDDESDAALLIEYWWHKKRYSLL